MPIKADRSTLPSTPDPSDGVAPDADDRFIREALTKYLDVAEPLDDELELAIPEAGPVRGSQAGQCARRISYDLDPDVEAAPFDMSSRWNFAMGTFIHDQVQAYGGGQAEVKVDLNPIGVKGSAHLDQLLDEDGRTVAVEIKSINGTGFKQAATRDRGPATGPKIAHLLQGGLAALALGADDLRLAYVAKENAAPWHVARHGYNPESPVAGFAAQWTLEVESLRPRLEREAKRLAKIVDLHEKGEWAPRSIVDEDVPASALIVNPERGDWTVTDGDGQVLSAGKTWQCDYCSYQERCAADLREGR